MREGWGLAYNPRTKTHFASDGSSKIFELSLHPSPVVKRTIPVTRTGGRAIEWLNDLEVVGDSLFANIYGSTDIAVIDLDSGLARFLDFSYVKNLAETYTRKISKRDLREDDVLNGIAYDLDSNKLIIAGKNWPLIFVIQLESDKIN